MGSFTSASSESSYLSDFSEGCDAVMEATTQGSSSCDGRKKTLSAAEQLCPVGSGLAHIDFRKKINAKLYIEMWYYVH